MNAQFKVNIIFSCILLLATFDSNAQTLNIDTSTGKYVSTNIIQVDSIKKEDIFLKTKEWIALNYKSANDVIQFADKESSKIIVKGNFSTGIYLKEGWIGHTLVIDIKDGKIRCSYTDFVYFDNYAGKIQFEDNMISFRKKLYSTTSDNIASSLASLKKYLLSKSQLNSDW